MLHCGCLSKIKLRRILHWFFLGHDETFRSFNSQVVKITKRIYTSEEKRNWFWFRLGSETGGWRIWAARNFLTHLKKKVASSPNRLSSIGLFFSQNLRCSREVWNVKFHVQALHFQRLANSWNLTVNGRWTKHKSGGNVCPWANSLQCQTQVLLYISSVQFSRSVVSDSLRPHGLQHTRPPCPSSTPRVYPNSCPLSRWLHHRLTLTLTPPSHPLSSPSSPTFNLS